MREGADWCRVTVQFTQNGRTYKLTRGLKRKGKGISQDIEQLKLWEGDRLVASMKTEAIEEQFKAITGLDKELYREIVWFHAKTQECSGRSASPRDRQETRRAFGLSDYEAAWSNVARVSTRLRNWETGLWKRPRRKRLGKTQRRNTIGKRRVYLVRDGFGRFSQKLAIAKRALDEADSRLKRSEEKNSRLKNSNAKKPV